MAADMVQTPLGKQVWARLFGYVDAQVDGKLRVCELTQIREMTNKRRDVDVLISRFRRNAEKHCPGEWLYSPFFVALHSGQGEINDQVVRDARKLLWRFKRLGMRFLFNPPDGIDVFGQMDFPREARPDLPQVFADRVKELAESMDIRTVDFEAYNAASMVRADGTEDLASYLYRVPLTYQDIQNWSEVSPIKVENPYSWERFLPRG